MTSSPCTQNKDQVEPLDQASEKRYGRPAWKKSREKEKEEKNNTNMAKGKSLLPKFTSNIQDFATVLDSLLVDYGIEMVRC